MVHTSDHGSGRSFVPSPPRIHSGHPPTPGNCPAPVGAGLAHQASWVWSVSGSGLAHRPGSGLCHPLSRAHGARVPDLLCGGNSSLPWSEALSSSSPFLRGRPAVDGDVTEGCVSDEGRAVCPGGIESLSREEGAQEPAPLIREEKASVQTRTLTK